MKKNVTGPAPTIILFSSNSRAKYFEDCLQTLMLPRGMVVHFRYRETQLEPAVKASIAQKAIVGQALLICYLYQELDSEGVLRPARAYALRAGKIVDVQLDGSSCHFYFEVSGYPTIDVRDALSLSARDAQKRGDDKFYATTIEGLRASQFTDEADDAGAFSSIANSFAEDDMRYPDRAKAQMVQRDAFFLRVAGVYNNGKTHQHTELKPSFEPPFSRLQPGYEVSSDDPLELRVQYEQPKWSRAEELGLSLVLTTTQECFSSPSRVEVTVGSPYDKSEFYLLPVRNNKGWLSRLELSVECDEGDPPKPSEIATTSFCPWISAKPRYPRRLIAALDAFNNLTVIFLAAFSAVIALLPKPTATVHVDPLTLIPPWLPILVVVLIAANVWGTVVKSRA